MNDPDQAINRALQQLDDDHLRGLIERSAYRAARRRLLHGLRLRDARPPSAPTPPFPETSACAAPSVGPAPGRRTTTWIGLSLAAMLTLYLLWILLIE